MDKMRMESVDMTAQNVEKIAALFPNCVTEALDEEHSTPEHKVYKKVINFDMLRQMLSGEVLEGDEAYEFTWVGKKAAIVEANKPIRMTLRPCPEESVNWDTTENLFIEGDNLKVLKLLQESYLGKVKMIYIDPPYNTGHDFVYPDSFIMDNEDYNEGTGYFDEDGNINYSRENSTAAGKYHSDWCSMLYSRILCSRNLLSEDGIIFISIDNNELSNLKEICDEIFGQENLITIFAIENNPKGRKNNAFIAESYEFCLVYAKNKEYIRVMISGKGLKKFFSGISVESDNRQVFFDNYGEFRQSKRQVCGANKSNALASESKAERCFVIYYYEPEDKIEILDEYDRDKDEWVISPRGQALIEKGYNRYACTNNQTGKPAIPLYSKETIYKLFREHSLYFKNDGTIYEKDRDTEQQVNSFIANKKYELDLMTESATSKMEDLFGVKDIFTNSKAVDFIKMLIKLIPYNDFICLDYFAGSATTAHALMELNAEDSGDRKYIMVQLPEKCSSDKPAFKAGYINICEIAKERIRRAGEQIKEKSPLTTQNLDIGFRVFKLDETNMKDVYYSADEISQQNILNMESNIKEDRTSLDLLFGCLLEWGLPLSLPYTSEQIDGCTVHTYNDGDVVACFDANIPDSVIKTIAKRRYHGACALRAVFRDSSFADSPAKINVGEIFKLLSPDTRVKVI